MGLNNPHHYTNYSDACAKAYGVGCDGTDEATGIPCDCPCHGDHAPVFETDADVEKWHGKGEPWDTAVTQ